MERSVNVEAKRSEMNV